MASRRKSTTPCMVPPREAMDSDQEMEDITDAAEQENSNGVAAASSEVPGVLEEQGEEADVRPVSDHYLDLNMTEGGYECKYCSFQTSELNLFTMHVDTEHPDVVLNTTYVCMECDYHTKSYDTLLAHNARLHPGEDNFTRTMVKRNNETIFQQTVNDLTFDGSFVKVEDDEAEETSRRGIALSKTPIMRIKSRTEPKKFSAAHKMAVNDVIKVESDDEDDENKEPPTLSPLKGGSSGGGMLPPGTLAQVLSALQNQNSTQTQTQLLIPISSIPTYNTAMDNNVLLVSAYNRFPYPSVSEITGLSSQTKFSEEQIKVWFSAQRLKHGVSWTPEEVEEARRKKFNGTVQTVPQTITVIPANIAAATNGLQSIFQTCQIVGQPGLVLTQVAGNSSTVPVASPITLTVKSKEQLAELKASYSRRQFATEAEISRLMQVTKLSKRAIKKWFSDTRYNQRKSNDHHSVLDPRVKFRHAFPDFTPQKFKEKTPEQLLVLEASFQKSDMPSDEELSRLRAETKLTRREVDAWFTERRKMPSAAQPKDEDVEEDDEKLKPAAAPSSSAEERQTTPPGGRKAVKKTPEQLHILKKAFVHTQWPTPEEYDQMAEESGLPRTYIVNWFGDTRYACKNSNLKWYYLYQSGKVQPVFYSSFLQVKSGKEFLKDYYHKHQALSEKDLDDLVTKSNMSYEQVRDWFSEAARRVEEGKEPFSDEEAEGEEDEDDDEAGAEHGDSEGEMEVKEQGEEASDGDCDEEEDEDEETQEESESVSQSHPEAEEQT
uniref:Zinc fingers and homeoboxes protein 1 n=1 Tax=Monopterus albus TaxID=43700 RepID=A0A3Q3QYF3_MONAL